MNLRLPSMGAPGRALARTAAALSALALGIAATVGHAQEAPGEDAPGGVAFAVMARDLPFFDVSAPADCVEPESGHGLCGADRLAWESLRLAARHDLETGRLAAARAKESAALALAVHADDRDGRLADLASLAAYEAVAGDAGQASRHLDAARAMAVHAAPRHALPLAEFAAVVAAAAGDDRRAFAAIEAGLGLAEPTRQVRDLVALLSLRARLEVARGDTVRASADVTRATVLGGARSPLPAARALMLDRALLDLATGHRADAVARLDALANAFAADGATALEVDALQAFGDALEQAGDAGGARALRGRAAAAGSPAARPDAVRVPAGARGEVAVSATGRVPAPALVPTPTGHARAAPPAMSRGTFAGAALGLLVTLAVLAACGLRMGILRGRRREAVPARPAAVRARPEAWKHDPLLPA